MHFRDDSFNPTDRAYSFAEDLNQRYPLTLGACSYTFGINFNFYAMTRRSYHVLIGRFAALSGEIEIFGGYNHNYKNVVSIYPFDSSLVVNKIRAAALLPTNDYSPQEKRFDNHFQVIIGNDVWIGYSVTIMSGVKIGNGAIIGAYSVVTKDVPPYAIVAGNPARIVRYRFDEATIKKFQSIRWWDWSLEKIYENLPLIYDTEKFLAKHYAPELENAPYEEIGGGYSVDKLRAEGRKIFACVADFRSPQPLWKRILSGFCQSTEKNSVLLLWTGKDWTPQDLAAVNELAQSIGFADGKMIHCLQSFDDKIFSPYILRRSTHFITTREMVTLNALAWLYDTDVKIVSALDEKIFAGETEVAWSELYKKT